MNLKDTASNITTAYDELKGVESMERKPEGGIARKALVQLRDSLDELNWNIEFLSLVKKMCERTNTDPTAFLSSLSTTMLQPVVRKINLALIFDQTGGDVRIAITPFMDDLAFLVKFLERIS